MNTSTRCRGVAAQLCAQWRAEDGIDPRLEKRGRKPRSSLHQDKRICREVERNLPLILASEAANPLLRDLRIVSVDLLDTGRRLHIVLTDAYGTDSDSRIEHALVGSQSWLRTELARNFHRKRMPLLSLEYVGGLSGEGVPCR